MAGASLASAIHAGDLLNRKIIIYLTLESYECRQRNSLVPFLIYYLCRLHLFWFAVLKEQTIF